MSAATLLTMLISLAGILLLVPGVLSLPTESLSNPEMLANAGETTIALFIAGAVLIVIYELAVSLLLAMVPYSLVIDDLGPRDAIRASIRFFRYNKFDVFMVWVISLALSIALQIAGSAFSTTGAEPSALCVSPDHCDQPAGSGAAVYSMVDEALPGQDWKAKSRIRPGVAVSFVLARLDQ
jgi:hypothetical protein